MKLCGGVGRLGIFVLGLLLATGLAKTASAAQGDCAQPVTTGSLPTASDCLFILRAAVGSAICDPACICAPKGSLPTTATDSLGNTNADPTTNELKIDLTPPATPTVDPLTSSDPTPFLTGLAVLENGEFLEVTVNGITYV